MASHRTGTGCTQPGCGGTIEDGFCDECGMAPKAGAPAPPANTRSSEGSAKCEQPGCDGTIEDGFCDECGKAPKAGPSASGASFRSAASNRASSRSAASGRTGSSRTGSGRSSSRRRIGAGLVEAPQLTRTDPASVVLADPQVPESRRFCGKCGEPLGRARGEQPGRPEGFCPACGQRFSFTPKLRAGDVVAGQYEVAGAIAHGGLGWIYLATDRNVSDRWVVLKGLLDSGDAAAAEAAVAERRFLAEVEHANIVRIYNFVESDGAGYIVMEYVGGTSLKDLLKQRRAVSGPSAVLPAATAIAYLLEVLPAFGYLHDRGLVYCDFKPDNVIQSGEQIRLIDLGAVVGVDDLDAAVYGTVGYQAPEIATDGPSAASDLYTVARTLAVLATDFRGYQSTYATSLPARADVELYRRFESLYRLLVRGTAPDPADRFGSAEEMSAQLLGVLREVLAAAGSPAPGPSVLFSAQLPAGADAGPDWRALPVPMVDVDDPAAAFLATATVSDPASLLALLASAPAGSPEVARRAVRAHIELGAARRDFSVARSALAELVSEFGDDWRSAYLDGVLGLAAEQPERARSSFDAVFSLLPGELAPRLGLAMASELCGQRPDAAGFYDVVSATDPGFTAAAFGLARCRLAGGDRSGAVAAYGRVPRASADFTVARVASVEALSATGGSLSDPGVAELTEAAELLRKMPVVPAELARLRVGLLERALPTVEAGDRVPVELLDGEARAQADAFAGADERAVRFELERCLRLLAAAHSGPERVAYVDRANAVRPRTLR